MKRKILLFSTFVCCLAASAQTQTAQDLYAKMTAPKANIEKIIKNEASKADSTSCHDLAVMFYQANDFTHAAACWDLARQKVVKFGKNYEKMLNFMALCYDETGDQKGIAHVMALMEEHNQHELLLPCDEPECMVDRAKYFAMKGDNAQAKDYFLRALNMPMTDEQKALVYEAYADFQTEVREFALASEYFLMAANAKKAVEGETEEYAQLEYKTAIYAYLGKEYEKSLIHFRLVIAFYEQHDTDAARKNIAKCRKGLGNSLSAMKDFAAARDEHRLAMEYYERYNPADEEYPNSIVRVATAEKFNGDYDASIEHYKQAISIYLERGMSEKANDTQNSLNLCYAYAGRPMDSNEDIATAAKEAQIAKLDAIIEETKGNLDIMRTYLGKLPYAESLGTIAGCYHAKEEYKESVAYYKQYMEAIRDAIRDEFRMQSEAERMTTWADEKHNMQEILEMLITLPEGSDALTPDLSALAYDCQLLSKGILLNSAIEFEKVVSASNDTRLQQLYAETKQTEELLIRLRQTASTDDDLENITRLQQKSQQLQLQLSRSCAELADFTSYIGYDWHDVQAKLTKDDVAIEFAAVDMGVFDDENQMLAIVLTKDMKHPIVVPVCTFEHLKVMQADTSNTYSTREAGHTVWGNLLPYIGDKRRIFFSADGAFNHIGIEYLLVDGTPLSQQKDVIRLSSTKELCYESSKTKIEHAAIFGDIDYTSEGTFSGETQRSVSAVRSASQSAGDGSILFADLKGTRKELNEISASLKNAHIANVLTFTQAEASEEAFRSLSDSKVHLLHIATHGAYLAHDKTTDAESMAQSILAFAGANLGNDGTATDGYITAADVAKMNLRSCQLAVLSACETALGKMGDDGVFGLQRGFKNAGVHTLLMSLRKVDDAATAELMTQFYQQLMAGNTPNESLRRAQQYLRQHGYDNPDYWASFIILDGNH